MKELETPANVVALLDVSPPHGGQLVNRMMRGQMQKAVQERAEELFKLELNSYNLSDLELIANGAMSPLTGFMGQADYSRVVSEMRLSNNLPWSLPITLAVSRETAENFTIGTEIALCENDRVLAVMEVSELYEYDKQREAEMVYGTTDESHPGVARLFQQGDVLVTEDRLLDALHGEGTDDLSPRNQRQRHLGAGLRQQRVVKAGRFLACVQRNARLAFGHTAADHRLAADLQLVPGPQHRLACLASACPQNGPPSRLARPLAIFIGQEQTWTR